MICPKCEELALKSKLNLGVGITTNAVFYPSYYDENGLYHAHCNRAKREAWCSQGHRLLIGYSNECPNCDFGYPLVITVQTDQSSNSFSISGTSGTIIFNNGTSDINTKGE